MDDNAVVMAGDDTQQFVAYVPAQRWNGWAKPEFTPTEARSVVEWIGRELDTYSAQWDGDVIVLTDYENEWTERIAVNGNGRYPIGAGAWTWDEVDDDDPRASL